MRRRLLIALVLIATTLVAFQSCKGGGQIDPVTPDPEPLLIDTTIIVPATGATSRVTILSHSGWKANVAAGTPWCHVTPAESGSGGATIAVKVDANDEFAVRQARVDIKNATTTGVINIIQQQIDVLDVTTDDICDFGPQGGTFAVNVGYNIDYTVTCSEGWVRRTQTKALQRATVMFEVDKNNSGGDRICEVRFEGGGFSHTITVSQIAAYLNLSMVDVALEATVDRLPVMVESNISYTVTLPGNEWMSITGDSAGGSDGLETSALFNLSLQENEGWFLREGDVIFGNPDYNITGNLHILQKAVDIMYSSLPLFEFGPEGGSFEFDTDPLKEYTLSSGEAGWITVSIPEDNLARRVITVAKSMEADERTGSILITRGSAKKTLDFCQKGTAPQFSAAQMQFATAGGSQTLTVTGSVEYTLVMPEDAPWCSAGKSESGEYIVTVAANDTESPRECRLVFKNEEYGVNEVVTVSQAQKDAFEITPLAFSFGPEGGRAQIGIHSNIEYDYTIDSPEWIVETRDATDENKVFAVALNATGDQRRGRVVFTAGGVETVVTIDQKAAYINASEHDFSLDDQPAERSFAVESNIPFHVKTDGGDWLSISSVSETGVSFALVENNEWGNRTATIIVSNDDYAAGDTVKVFQGAKYYLDIAQTEFDLPPQGGTVALDVISNKEYSYRIDGSPEWISETSQLVFEISPNTGEQAREVHIIFEQNGLSKGVSISQDAPALIVSPTSIDITAAGGEASFSVSGNIPFEVGQPSSDWVQCEPLSASSYTLGVSPNEVTEIRICTIEVSSPAFGRSVQIKIIQTAKGIFELLSDSFALGPEGGEIAVEVNTNVDFVASSDADWVTGEGLSFAVSRNVSGQERSCSIEYLADGYTYYVTVTQDPAYVNVSKTQLDLPVGGGKRSFEVVANVDYAVIAPADIDWVSVSATDDDVYEVEVTMNGGEQARECVVQVVSADYDITREVAVIQERSDFFELNTTELTFGPEGGNAEVDLRTNIDYTCTIGAEWIADGGDLTYSVGKNATGEEREGTIEFEAAGETYSVSVRQMAAWLDVGPQTVSIDQEGGSFTITAEGNIPFDVVMPQEEWISVSEDSEEGKYAFEVAEFADFGTRACSLVFEAEEYGLSRTVRVTQKGIPDPFSMPENSFFVGPCGGNLEVVHSECSDIDVSIYNNWLREIPSLRSDTRLVFNLDTLYASNTRESAVSVTGNGKTVMVYIFQNPPLLTLQGSSKRIKAEGGTITTEVTTNMPLNFYCDDGWVSGKMNEAGNKAVFTVAPNDTGLERTTVVDVGVRELNCTKPFTITQEPNDMIVLSPTSCSVSGLGGECDVTVEANVPVYYSCSSSWISCNKTADDNVYHITIQANTSAYSRETSVWFTGGRATAIFTISQEGYRNPDYYSSQDFSRDRKVTNLQHATEGSGIQLILMGDAFSDRLIADGTYAAAINNAVDALFAIEPFASFRNMFDINMVDVVSVNEIYASDALTALGTGFKSGSVVEGNDSAVYQYAQAVNGYYKGNVLVIVIMNVEQYGGTTYLQYPTEIYGDYGMGNAIAYVPLCASREQFVSVLQHEAGGHGFGKLQDEYYYSSNGAIPDLMVAEMQDKQSHGFYKNIDFTSDPEQVRWAEFLQDDRYQYDGLGVFEGACGYSTGAYRPTQESMMYHNEGPFNAPSREAIYYRLHKLAYGNSWVYDREAFVEYDVINRRTSPRASRSGARGASSVKSELPPLPPPVLVAQ